MLCATCKTETAASPCTSCGEAALLAGRFALEHRIAETSHAVTYRAVDRDTGHAVCVKETPYRTARDIKAVELVEREARVLAQLRHPQIPRYVDHFEYGDGGARAFHVVLELIEGQTLREEMETRRYTEQEVVQIARAMATVLDYLHGLSPPVIHRDVKPSNVIRCPDGQLVLVDFGAVRDQMDRRLTGGHTIAGTIGFMAPEQLRGEAFPATDIFALGATMVMLLTRLEPADMTDHAGQLHWKQHAQASPETAALIDVMMSANPDARPTAREVALHSGVELVAAPPRPVSLVAPRPSVGRIATAAAVGSSGSLMAAIAGVTLVVNPTIAGSIFFGVGVSAMISGGVLARGAKSRPPAARYKRAAIAGGTVTVGAAVPLFLSALGIGGLGVGGLLFFGAVGLLGILAAIGFWSMYAGYRDEP